MRKNEKKWEKNKKNVKKWKKWEKHRKTQKRPKRNSNENWVCERAMLYIRVKKKSYRKKERVRV